MNPSNIYTPPKERVKPYINAECKKAIANARRARQKWIRSFGSSFLKKDLNRLEAICSRTLQKSKETFTSNYVASIESGKEPKKLWSFTKSIMGINNVGRHSDIIFENNDGVRSSPDESASILLHHYSLPSLRPFANVNAAEEGELLSSIEQNIATTDFDPLNLPYTLGELNRAFVKFQSNALGPDLIHNKMLQHLDQRNRLLILHLFNLTFTFGFIPDHWKCATIIPVLKPGKPPDKPDSMRPISLTSNVCKCCERMVNNRLKWHLESNKLLPNIQTGFRSGFSTMDNILKLETFVREGFNKSMNTYSISLDLTKAFDITWSAGLLHKLSKLGIKGNLLRWLKLFLIGRKIRVSCNNVTTDFITLLLGLPQGSVLSPTLFLIMLYDFPKPCSQIELSLFADDAEFHIHGKSSQQVQNAIQRYLDRINDWAAKWRLIFSGNKCGLMIFTRSPRDDPPTLKLNNDIIPVVRSAKVLGVTFDTRLTWSPHITILCNKLVNMANAFKLLASNKLNLKISTLVRLYKAIARSKVDYGAIVLSTANKTQKERVEVAQRQILRILLGAQKSTPRPFLYADTGIEPISDRWNLLAAAYIVRLNFLPSNPLFDIIKKRVLNTNTTWRSTSIPAAHTIIKKHLADADIFVFTGRPATIKAPPPWLQLDFELIKFPLSKKEAQLNPHFARQLFFEFQSKLPPNCLSVYTDGSKNDNPHSVGCAFVIPDLQIGQSWSLPSHSTVYHAELWALRKCIDFIYTLDHDDIIIFSDSLSSLQAIQHHHSSQDRILRDVVDSIIACKSAGIRIRLAWIPSHVGIPGNEAVDKLANTGRTSPTNGSIICRPTTSDLLAKFKDTWNKKITDAILTYSPYPSISAKSKLGPLPWHLHPTRKFTRILHKLRSEHNRLNGHLSKFELTLTPDCALGCHSKENSCHILIDCPYYSAHRNALISFFALHNIPYTLDNLLGYNLSLPNDIHFQVRDLLVKFLIDSDLHFRI